MPRRVASGSIRPAKARAPNVYDGKERVASAHPQIWPRNRKVPGPYFFAGFAAPGWAAVMPPGAPARGADRGPQGLLVGAGAPPIAGAGAAFRSPLRYGAADGTIDPFFKIIRLPAP